MADQALKQSLINELAVARSQFGVNKAELREDLAIGRKLKRQLRQNPVPWFAGAAVLGLLLSKLPPMRRKVVVKPPKIGKTKAEDVGKAGIAVALFNFALQMAKPTLMRMLRERFMSSFRSRTGSASRREHAHAGAAR
jgi:hypothetical protein